jgi:xylulose-5-phosphate/fructose-6-phosphate phosphoketolase
MDFSSNEYFKLLDKYFRAANYLSLAQLYLLKNPLLKDEFTKDDIKKRIVGHWGTVPGQNFVYAHLDRVIQKYDLNMILLSGPGHGGNFFLANSYLEGTYSEVYKNISEDKEGMTKFCKQFSFPGGVSSHVAPAVPGSMHEGGELGYSLAHGYGAVLDNPDLIATVIVGDGEAETGPLATSWHANKFINPKTDGAVLPILHLNGFKINNPTVLSRISKTELLDLFKGYGYAPIIVEGDKPMLMHRKMAKALDRCIERIKEIQNNARKNNDLKRPIWPMIILRTPKGWTGPKVIDGLKYEGTFRMHQVPLTMEKPEHFDILKKWLLSYKPEELFENYKLKKEIANILPKGNKRISANPITNIGVKNEIITPNIYDYEVKFNNHGEVKTQDMLELSGYMRDIFKLNKQNNDFRVFSPDEAMSNRMYKLFEVEKRDFNGEITSDDDNLSQSGKIMDSYLSEHLCEGLLEGYVLTGRYGTFATYEAFIRVCGSMVSQHAKWLKVISELKWRNPIPSLNLILTSNVWQQDHNGYTHQDPGFLGDIVNKKLSIVRMYLPPDSNCLISCFDHCLKSKNYVNVIVASKHPSYQWLSMNEAIAHCKKGLSVWKWASMNDYNNPDIVMVSCGDTPNLESLACVKILKEYLPKLNLKFINIVDLTTLIATHSHGLSNVEFDEFFTTSKPVIFNFHGYPSLIHELTYNRTNPNFIVSGYDEEGTITTPFDIRVSNKIDRFHLVMETIKHLTIDENLRTKINNDMEQKLKNHKEYIEENGVDLPEILDWKW